MSVITADKICYVNMNSAFREGTADVSEDISVYSVVNSILDSCDAEKVQISVEGSMDGNFRESLPLYKFYEKNENLVVQDDKKES